MSTSAPSFSSSPGAALNWPVLDPAFNPPSYVATNLDITTSVNENQGWDFRAHFTDYVKWFPASGHFCKEPRWSLGVTTIHMPLSHPGKKIAVALDPDGRSSTHRIRTLRVLYLYSSRFYPRKNAQVRDFKTDDVGASCWKFYCKREFDCHSW